MLFSINAGFSEEKKKTALGSAGPFTIDSQGNGGNCLGCQWIAIQGILPPNAGELFKQFVRTQGLEEHSIQVILHSNGGSLLGGVRLGRAIRSQGSDTQVGKSVKQGYFHALEKGQCLSACAYAFLGGVTRFAEAGEIGIHQFYTNEFFRNPDGKVFTPKDFSSQQALNGLLLSYVTEMGAKPDLVIKASSVGPDDMLLLNEQQLTEFSVTFIANEYQQWNLEAYGTGLISYSRTKDRASQMTLMCSSFNKGTLLITKKVDDAKEYLSFLNRIQKFSWFGQTILLSEISIRTSGNVIYISVPLNEKRLEAMRTNKKQALFIHHSDEPHVNWYIIQEEVNFENFTKNFRLVRKNCL
ncbi:hypothetical protein [Cohaesibacter gelatinilyticus]|nr:hypothetical protein [Cohaesibacter gelatinilyticus]